ncbi:MAG: enoyl-CoA hydratase [Azospirillaceae bacterium]|nr:enoyl-CoA hydratase [Azospirillaceae bacterium]
MGHILYEVRERVALVTLNRPDRNNAQNADLLKELDETFDRAVADDGVRVIVLLANGKHFSAGHDIAPDVTEKEPWSSMFDDVGETGLLRMYDWEEKHYFGYSRKWRDLPKPTIAAVQGACIAAGLMLAWPMDLIIAADDARFSDPVVRMGIGGVEYHGHAWEFGARKAKELLFTAGYIDATEAHRLGMVNRVVPRAELESQTLTLAGEIAKMHPHALRMAKRSVNATLDAMGQHQALAHGFDLHSLGHANAWATWGKVTTAGLAEMTQANKESRKA